MTDSQLASNAEWREWGKKDPLWGVASWPGRERGGATPWTDEEFYALGADWDDFDRAWRQCGRAEAEAALEIGCGAGRITRMLARTFVRVIASDVSEDMIAYARARLNDSNIEWRLSDGVTLAATDASIDAVFSCHVFQHFPDNRTQLRLFGEIFRVLRPGGTFFVHIPMHAFPESNANFVRFARRAYSEYLRIAAATIMLRRLRMKLGGKPYMRGVSYEMRPLLADLRGLGFHDVAISMVNVGPENGLHSCIFGRRP